MDKEYFTFFRSFYEAVRMLPPGIRAEALTAIIEYGLYGTISDKMGPTTSAIFTLIKPNIDHSNVRKENGKKGGMAKAANRKSLANSDTYSLTYDEEIALLKKDKEWIKGLCSQFSVATKDMINWLCEDFLQVCKSPNRKEKSHVSLEDAKSHFRYWLDKRSAAFSTPSSSSKSSAAQPPDYDYNPFNSLDK